MELSYTWGPMNLNWKQIMQHVASDDRFYMNTEEDEVTEKEAGWEFLRMYGKDDEESGDDDDEDSEFDEKDEGETSVEESEEVSEFDSEEDEESDFDGDEELEEQGMDWDEMEKLAASDDRRKSKRDIDDPEPAKEGRNRSTRGSNPGATRRGSNSGATRGRSPVATGSLKRRNKPGSVGAQKRRRR